MAADIHDMTLRCPTSWNASTKQRARDIALGMRDQWDAFAGRNPTHAQRGFILAKRARREYVVQICYGEPNTGSYIPVTCAFA